MQNTKQYESVWSKGRQKFFTLYEAINFSRERALEDEWWALVRIKQDRNHFKQLYIATSNNGKGLMEHYGDPD